MALYYKRDPTVIDFDRLLNEHINPVAINTSTEVLGPDKPDDKLSKYLGGSFNARLDLTETPTGYLLHADLPGIPKELVQVSVKDDMLTLSGERAQQREEKDDNRHIVERSQGKFSRSVQLPKDANAEDVKATMEHGVLQLVFGKKAHKEEDGGIKKITIDEFDRILNAHLNSLSSANEQERNQQGATDSNKMSKYWGGSFNARLDLTETPKNYFVHADLPGIPKEHIQISVKDDILTLSGERAQRQEEKDEHRHIVERGQGKFSRSLRLPPDASVDDVKATMKDGVLELVVGKKAKVERVKSIVIE
ncbi:hypothetical protein HDU81_002089 [Chytriomyces hyalinus]|nr:hypothetical protein HDU81_002089 [Chytriomyces hyalinus]